MTTDAINLFQFNSANPTAQKKTEKLSATAKSFLMETTEV
jgi:hypothetical protein